MSFGKRGAVQAERGAVVRPQAAARAAVEAAPAPAGRVLPPVSHAPFAKWTRLPAAIVDMIVPFVIPWICIGMLDAYSSAVELSGMGALFWAGIVSAGYYAAMESSQWQATLGKRMMGLIVTDAAGARIGLGRALLRNTLGRFVSNLMPFNLGYLCVLFMDEAKAAHDFVAGTRVRRADHEDWIAEAFA